MAKRKQGDAHKEQRWLYYGDLAGRLPGFWHDLDIYSGDPGYVEPCTRNGNIPIPGRVTLTDVIFELRLAAVRFGVGAYECIINGRPEWTYKASHIARELSSRFNAVVPVWMVQQAQQAVKS